MAIRGLKKSEVTSFIGRDTSQNATDAKLTTLLTAKNLLVLADNQLRRMPGYDLFQDLGIGPVHSIFDFQRTVDQKQFIIAHVGGSIVAVSGGAVTVLSQSESSVPFQFVSNAFICYGSNGQNAWRFVDNAGTLTRYAWGIAKPSAAPAISNGSGTLTLTYGRRYVVSDVSKYTDSLGILRISVGKPSDYSAHTGPVTAAEITLSGIPTATDPQVTHHWIFATADSPLDDSSTFEFAAEIPNATTTWADTLQDTDLDNTQLAPFDNNPAPPSAMLTTWQNRVAAAQGSQLRLSGFGEIPLGIPEEAWPLSLFFNVPGGARQISGIVVNDDGNLLVGTTDYWFMYSGYDATTFTEQDRIAQPGPAGPLALCRTPYGIVWMSLSKRLWLSPLRSAGTHPQDLSVALSLPAGETLSMEDIASAGDVRLHWYAYGRQQFLIAQCIAGADSKSWFQVWSVDSSASGMALYETDKFPTDLITGSGNATLNGVAYVLCGDSTGKVYRFPSTYTDNGVQYESQGSTPWLNLNAKGRLYWVDMIFETPADLEQFGFIAKSLKVWAAVEDAPNPNPQPMLLDLQPIPSPEGGSNYTVRANLQQPALNTGRFIRLWMEFPNQVDADVALLRLTAWYAPKWAGTP